MSHLQDEHGRAHSRGELPLKEVVGRITENRRKRTPPPPKPKDVIAFERKTTKVFAWMRVAVLKGQVRLPDRPSVLEQELARLTQVYRIPIVVDPEQPTRLAPSNPGD
jgi:hypothetical protein